MVITRESDELVVGTIESMNGTLGVFEGVRSILGLDVGTGRQPARQIRRKNVTTLRFERIRRITIELTRRREFTRASPDESSCETRSRRSRPTICYAELT